MGNYLDADGVAHLSSLIKRMIRDTAEQLELEMPRVMYGTKEEWDSDVGLVSQADTLYIYTDYLSEAGQDVAGLKVGDGTTYLIDRPFLNQMMIEHINNTDIHITPEERAFWNNKVRCYTAEPNDEELVFTTT